MYLTYVLFNYDIISFYNASATTPSTGYLMGNNDNANNNLKVSLIHLQFYITGTTALYLSLQQHS